MAVRFLHRACPLRPPPTGPDHRVCLDLPPPDLDSHPGDIRSCTARNSPISKSAVTYLEFFPSVPGPELYQRCSLPKHLRYSAAHRLIHNCFPDLNWLPWKGSLVVYI